MDVCVGWEQARAMLLSQADVLITAVDGDPRLAWEARAAGCDAFILKPGLEELAELLRRHATTRTHHAG